MKLIIHIARILVGGLFIFSGLIKANDPLGLAYKMQEFFEVWGGYSGLKSIMLFLSDYALWFSIIMITFEIIAGIALLVGWRMKLFSRLLLILIIFFIFLTGFALFSGKIRTCGCFGDCIPLTPLQSFIKDLILFFLILLIFFNREHVKPFLAWTMNSFVILVSLVLTLFFQFYVLEHLPFKDCLPYKVGNNLLKLREVPADATQDKVEHVFIYEKNNQKKEFTASGLPDSTWKFVDRQDNILEKGINNEPPIKDFILNTLSGIDSTKELLSQPNTYYLYFLKDATKSNKWIPGFTKLLDNARSKHIPLYVIASQASAVDDFLNNQNHFDVTVFSCDVTALKTASRTNPSVYFMQGPVVMSKWGKADINKIK